MSHAKLLFETVRGLVEWVITPMPGPAGYAVRWVYYKLILGGLGWGTLIDTGVRIENPRSVFIGRRVWIDRNVLILGAVKDPHKGRPGTWIRRDPEVEGRVVIGDETHVAPQCVLSGLAGLRIGSCVGLASGTRVYTFSHHLHHLDTGEIALFTPRTAPEKQFLLAGPVRIGDRSGVGINGVVLPGAILADDAFLAVASVLRGDTEVAQVYAGNPAKAARPRAKR